MLLALDIGNTQVTIGLFSGTEIIANWRLTTGAERTADEWIVALEAFILRTGHAPAEVRSACLASVAPDLTQGVIEAIRRAITNRVGIVSPESELPVRIEVEEPLAVGADRIANVLGVLARHPGDSIVVDFGTATTFDCVTGDRRFIGGVIMPGIRTATDQLIRRAAKLSATELLPPTRAIGKRTDENIRAGVLFGTADAVDGLVRRIRAEWPDHATPKVVATGGLASLIAPLSTTIERVDPDLTLHGLRVAAEALGLGT
jgi:type III pantothenate kinase